MGKPEQRVTRTRYTRWPIGRVVLIRTARPFWRPMWNTYPGETIGVVFPFGRRATSWVWPLTWHRNDGLVESVEIHLAAEAAEET